MWNIGWVFLYYWYYGICVAMRERVDVVGMGFICDDWGGRRDVSASSEISDEDVDGCGHAL